MSSTRRRSPGVWEAFSRLLVRLREEGGYPSARHFYRSWGGRPYFGCTYEQFVNVERGRSAAQPALVEKISAALRVWAYEDKAREFFTAYLGALLASPGLLELVLKSLAPRGPEFGSERSVLRKAVEHDLEGRRFPLSQAQLRVVTKDSLHFWCYQVFALDHGAWQPAALGKLLEAAPGSVRRALEALRKAGLALKNRDGSFESPAKRKVFTFPRSNPFLPDQGERLRRFYDERIQASGGLEMHQTLALRGSPADLRQYFSYLAQAVQAAGVYAQGSPADGTALFLVEGRVSRVLPRF